MSFATIIKLIDNFRDHCIVQNIDINTKITNLTESLNKELLKFNIEDKNKFIDDNQGELFKIHDTLVGKFAKLYLKPKQIDNLRTIHDRFFKNMLSINVPRRRFARLPTWLVTEFCKGITYFSNNSGIDAMPLNRNNLQNKIFLRNCYIERKIYDIIYSKIFYEQDINHLVELYKVERLYQDNYHKEGLKIFVNLADGIHPTSLELEWNDNEFYYKKIGKPMITCKRQVFNVNKKMVHIYDKTQTFLQETPWILI